MSHSTELLDATVLDPAPMRGLLMQLAHADLFEAEWWADIHREWIEALLRNEPQRERTCDLRDRAMRDCLVTGYAFLIPALTLPDVGDRHVLIAAIVCECDVTVAQNLKHFPAAVLALCGIEAQHPVEFLSDYLGLAPGMFCDAMPNLPMCLKHSPYSVDEYLDMRTQQGSVATAAELEGFAAVL